MNPRNEREAHSLLADSVAWPETVPSFRAVLDPSAVDARAKRAYESACAHCHPTWEQLGEITKTSWREQAARELAEQSLD